MCRALLLVYWLMAAGYVPMLGQYDPLGCRLVAGALAVFLVMHLARYDSKVYRRWLFVPLLALTALAACAGGHAAPREWVCLVAVWGVYLADRYVKYQLRTGDACLLLAVEWGVLGLLIAAPVAQAFEVGSLVLAVVALLGRGRLQDEDALCLAASFLLSLRIGYIDWGAVWSPDWFTMHDAWRPRGLVIWYGLAAIGATYLIDPFRPMRSWVRLGAMLWLLLLLRFSLLLGLQSPAVDLFLMMQEGCQYLLEGANPYAHQHYLQRVDMSRVPGATADDERLHTYVYPPGVLLLSVPGYVLAHDVRYSYVLTDLALLFLWWRLSRGEDRGPPPVAAQMLLMLYFVVPGFPLFVAGGWTDPLVVFWLSLVAVLLVTRKWPWAYFIMGASPTLKQQALPLIPTGLRTAWPARAQYWIALLLGMFLPVLPFAWGNLREFLTEMTMTLRMTPPPDSICLWTYFVNVGLFSHPRPTVVLLGVLLAGVVWLTQPPTLFGFLEATTLVLFCLFFLGNWTYLNYFWLISACMLLSMLKSIRFEAAGTSQTVTTVERLERLAVGGRAYRFLALVGLGIWFETYDIFMVGYLGTGLVKSGFLTRDDLGTFMAVGFLGMFLGTTLSGWLSDRLGRRPAFAWLLVVFSVFTLAGALAPSAVWLFVFRFLAGVGIGGETIVIDSYVTEMMPARVRGRTVAFTQVVGFTSVPAAAFLARWLVPLPGGWRWAMAIGSLGAAAVWLVRRHLPESPRWLEAHGRHAEADTVLRRLERAAGLEPVSSIDTTVETASAVETRAMWQPPYLQRSVMLAIFNALQTVGFYGFANWYPRFMMEQGVSLVDALQYASVIALTAPGGALIGLATSDRWERKWTLMTLSVLVAMVGMAFGQARTGLAFVACGIGLTLLVHWFSSVFHAWQCELYPTRFRTTAVGFTYGLSRLSAAAAAWIIAAILKSHGVDSVFAFMAAAMGLVAVDVACLSPTVNHRLLEDV